MKNVPGVQDGTLGTGVKLVMPSGNSYVGVNVFSSVVICLGTPLPKINEYISQFQRYCYYYSSQTLLGSPES